MLKKILLALIFVITAITNVTHAEDDMKTVASKAYVDTKIETKQLKIPAANQPNVDAGETVMTYTATGNGQIGERGLYSDISSYNATTDGDKLITASALNATFTNLPTTPTTKLECANSPACTLWTIVDQTAYGDMLPNGYTRLEYVEFTGTQYIDTGIAIKKSYEIRSKFKPTTLARYLYGALSSGNTASATAYINSNGNWRFGNGAIQKVLNLNTVYTSVQNVSQLVVNGVTTAYSTINDFETPVTLVLGTAHNTNETYSTVGFVGNIYEFRILDGNRNDLMNLVPAQHDSDGKVGFYDTVSGNFFTNAATSDPDFTAGPPAN